MSPLTSAFAQQELTNDLDLNLELQQRLRRHKDAARSAAEALTAEMHEALAPCRQGTALTSTGLAVNVLEKGRRYQIAQTGVILESSDPNRF